MATCLLAASCGFTRDDAETAAAATDADTETTTADGSSDTAGDEIAPDEVSVPDESDIDFADVSATVTLASGETVEITKAELDSLYQPLVDDTEFVLGAYQGTVPSGLRASMLTDMIVGLVLNDLVTSNSFEVSDANQEEGDAVIASAVAALFPLDEDPLATARARFDTVPYLGFLGDLQAAQIALGDGLLDAAPAAETAEVPCSSHILLESEDEALAVVAELEAGADFATLAVERSTGPSGPAGGELGCTDPNTFVAEFRDAIIDAPVGTIIGPVQTQFGFHVITVTGTEEQALGGPVREELVNAAVLGAISQLEVETDPAIGTWDNAQGGVAPATTN